MVCTGLLAMGVHGLIEATIDLVPHYLFTTVYFGTIGAPLSLDIVMEVIRHAESIVEWFLWTIEHTNRSLDIQCNVSPITDFVRHTLYART